MISKPLIKIGLAILLLICLAELPYGFYQLVRFIAMVVFGYLAVDSQSRGDTKSMWIYILLAILFQPIFKIALGRTIWNIVDVVVAIGLTVSALLENSKPKTEE